MSVDVEVDGRIAVITLDRPEARNAINGEMAAALGAALERLEDDPQLWVGVLAARGPIFCAGADLKEIAGGAPGSRSTERGGFAGIVRLARRKPLIAAVDAPALAGGCEIAIACDLIVASETATFATPEVKRALVAGAGGLFRLPRALPTKVAMQMLLCADALPAQRAYALGLVNELCAPGRARETAVAMARRICANAPVAVRISREVALGSQLADDDEAWRMSDEAVARVRAAEDFAEGPRAFVEKREPRWTGR